MAAAPALVVEVRVVARAERSARPEFKLVVSKVKPRAAPINTASPVAASPCLPDRPADLGCDYRTRVAQTYVDARLLPSENAKHQ